MDKVFLDNELKSELKTLGADFVYLVDISKLSNKQNQGYPNAILLGIPLSRDYIKKVSSTPDYVKNMVRNNQVEEDEFFQKEKNVDSLADNISDFIRLKGYSAYSQSENNLSSTGLFNEETKSSPLPHKTIAGLAGLGWIGKHNLLVTPKYGSAICMCTILTDAPLKAVSYPPKQPLCGDCEICKNVCPVKAIRGNSWSLNTSRDELVDIYKCSTCIQCLALCPWTQKYVNGKF